MLDAAPYSVKRRRRHLEMKGEGGEREAPCGAFPTSWAIAVKSHFLLFELYFALIAAHFAALLSDGVRARIRHLGGNDRPPVRPSLLPLAPSQISSWEELVALANISRLSEWQSQ